MRLFPLLAALVACSAAARVGGQPVAPPPMSAPPPAVSAEGASSVLEFGAVADGKTDATAAFQAALDAVGKAGGGRVYAPAGVYLVAGHLDIPDAVTLAGSFETPARSGAISGDPSMMKGTILLAVEGRGDADGPPFITLHTTSVLTGVTVFYPEQTTTDIMPYPWCVRGIGDNCTIADVLLVNPYQAVDFGTIHAAGRHFIDGLYAQPLKTGLFVDKCYDVGRVQNVHFWPFWNWDAPVKNYMLENGTAFVFGRTDWEYLSDCFALGYKVGFHFISKGDGPGNVLLTQCGSDLGPLAVKVDQVQAHSGVSFVNCQLMSSVEVSDANRGPVKFTACGFWGIETTDTEATIRGEGHVTFTACHFTWWGKVDPAAYAIVAEGGGLTVNGCEFLDEDPRRGHVRLGEDVAAAVVVANRFRTPAKIENFSEGEVAIADNVSTDGGTPLGRAIDAGDVERVASLWEARLGRGPAERHSAKARLASAIAVGDAHPDLRDALLRSVADDPTATESLARRARDELALVGEAPAGAADGPTTRPTAVARRLAGELTIDGTLDDPAWADAVPVAHRPGGESVGQYDARVLWDDRALYLGVRVPEPSPGTVRAEVTTRDGPVWQDDCVEFFLAPGRSTSRYVQLIVNAAGTYYDGTGSTRSTSAVWDSGATVASDRADGAWTVELSVPWAHLGHPAPKPGDVWSADLRRWRPAEGGKNLASWSDAPADDGATHHPESFGFVTFE